MLTGGGAKILDFGLAKWLGPDSDPAVSAAAVTAHPTLTQMGAVVGTIQYMAPEQVEGQPADARSDLFALGTILYEMTTGKKAFEGTSAASVMSAILTGSPTPIQTLVPLTPPALDRLVRKCLAKDPARRWQTAADLGDELAWIREDSRTTSGRVPLPVPTAPSATPTRLLWSVFATVIVLIIIGLGIVSRTQQPASRTAPMWVRAPDLNPNINVCPRLASLLGGQKANGRNAVLQLLPRALPRERSATRSATREMTGSDGLCGIGTESERETFRTIRKKERARQDSNLRPPA